MIRGVVNARHEAIVRLRVRGPGGAEIDTDAIVDSGFTSSMTLPPDAVAALGLARQAGGRATLADGSTRSFDLHAAEVEWDGARRPVLVSGGGANACWGCRCSPGIGCASRSSPAARWTSRPCPDPGTVALAASRGYRSVALPMIGAGSGGGDAGRSGRWMADELAGLGHDVEARLVRYRARAKGSAPRTS